MTLAIDRCACCGGLVDLEDLFCANCGTEVPDRHKPETTRLPLEARNFHCRGCGAAMNYDAQAQSLKCPFCGSVDLVEEAQKGILSPECVIPFAIDRVEAENRLRAWLGSGFWHPGDLRMSAQLTELRAVFVPFWIFSTAVKTHWTGDTSQTPWGASASWYPMAGQAERHYDGIWIPASAGIPVGELNAVLPFNAAAAVPPEQVNLEDITVEQMTVSRRYARPRAQGHLEGLETQAAAQSIPGSNRNVHVNVLLEDATSQSALVPVYVMAYRYRDHVYRFVINGQTGKATGTAPFATSKLVGILAVVALIVLIGLILAFLL